MPFDWSGYLDIAKEFQTKTTGQINSNEMEAMRRIAISRAYYSIYHLSVDYAKTKLGYVPKKGGVNQFHSDIRAEFSKQMGDWKLQGIKNSLAMMHKARIGCDYDASLSGDLDKLLKSVLLEAEKVKTTLNP